jgi:hypothetical protein
MHCVLAKEGWKGNNDTAYAMIIQEMLENQHAYQRTLSLKKAVRETVKGQFQRVPGI